MLFFRYGITPTANKLYQLVRKGSMSAPSEALTRFWSARRAACASSTRIYRSSCATPPAKPSARSGSCRQGELGGHTITLALKELEAQCWELTAEQSCPVQSVSVPPARILTPTLGKMPHGCTPFLAEHLVAHAPAASPPCFRARKPRSRPSSFERRRRAGQPRLGRSALPVSTRLRPPPVLNAGSALGGQDTGLAHG